jgi:hypothetical protein
MGVFKGDELHTKATHGSTYSGQMARRTLFITTASVVVAVVAALAALWSGYEAHRTRIDDERPYISAVPSKDPNQINFAVVLQASGRSPALNVRLACLATVQPDIADWKKIENDSDLGNDRVQQNVYLIPGQKMLRACAFSEYVKSYDSVVYGVVLYEDSSHDQYETPFCNRVYTSQQTTAPCVKDVDYTGIYPEFR